MMFESVAKIILMFVILAFVVMSSVVAVIVIRETILWIRWKWREKHGKKVSD